MTEAKTYLSLSKIGARLGISKQAVHKAAERNNLVKNPVGKYAFEDVTNALRSEQSERQEDTKTRHTKAVLTQTLLLIKIEQAEQELAETKGRLVAIADDGLLFVKFSALELLPTSLALARISLIIFRRSAFHE